jgi:hypothetical protein
MAVVAIAEMEIVEVVTDVINDTVDQPRRTEEDHPVVDQEAVTDIVKLVELEEAVAALEDMVEGIEVAAKVCNTLVVAEINILLLNKALDTEKIQGGDVGDLAVAETP